MQTRAALLFAFALLAAGCTAFATKPLTASTTLEARSGSSVTGSARFTETQTGVHGHVELKGLAAGSTHGFHVHEKGDCSAPDGASAGGHFNPSNTTHGRPDSLVHHFGDLAALSAEASGNVRADFDIPGVTIAAGANSIVGRSLVVHRDADDYLTQPSGNSGPRIACGVIVAP
jgi:superoxide dismutase, Cu-Zn family